MAQMTVRSTYALDAGTAEAIRELAAAWEVSQAEVIRRAVRGARGALGGKRRTPLEVLEGYRDGRMPVSRGTIRARLRDLKGERLAGDRVRARRAGAGR